MPVPRRIVLPMLALIALGVAVHGWILTQRKDAADARTTRIADKAWKETHTAHYLIVSDAPQDQVALTGAAVEHLHAAWAQVFPDMPRTHPSLRLVLYRSRAEFKANNRGVPWAEAIYRTPECHAYVADGENRVHWMVHEAAHQLAREVMGFERVRWIDEGLAGYFGASRIDATGLHPGTLDPNTYPLWWLAQFHWSGNLERDLREGRLIPLRALIEDTGPPIAGYVNLYYIEYWSLTHFLLHGENGKYAAGYKRLLANGATLADFEREIGPTWQIQVAWYAWMREQRARLLAESAEGVDGARDAGVVDVDVRDHADAR
ncbi:hypothetical protein [Noviluteimonas dokdonensis]|uniref:hypothetical protein n=1 Tax=Noviluteimonas dokdonensis TaxID=414050 RepID=UPI00056D1260|nr:hypothetical protein [Lysobacter dokdonensis]